jgi:hypothetical protein
LSEGISSQIAVQAGAEAVRFCHGQQCRTLGVTNFQHRQPAGVQQAGQLRQDATIIIEPVGAGKQGAGRFMGAHFFRKCFCLSDIGWIAEDQIEAFIQSLPPVAEPETGPPSRIGGLGILLRHGQGRRAGIDAKAGCS